AGYNLGGIVSTETAIEGPATGAGFASSTAFTNFVATGKEKGAKPIKLTESKLILTGHLNAAALYTGPAPAKTEAEKSNPYRFMSAVTVTKGKFGINAATYGDYTINNITADCSIDKGLLAFSNKDSVAETDKAEGKDRLVIEKGLIDFNANPVACSLQLRSPAVDLAQAAGTIEGEITIDSGIMYFPAPDAKKTPLISWKGFDSDSIMKTLSINDGTFLINDLTVSGIKREGRVGRICNGIADKLGMVVDKLMGGKIDEKSYSYKTVNGEFNINANIINISRIDIVGKDTADYLVNESQVKRMEELDMRIYCVGHVSRLLPMDEIIKLVKQAPFKGLKDASDKDLEKSLSKRMEEQAKKGKFRVKVQGSMSSPEITDVEKWIPAIITAILPDLGTKVGENILNDLLGGNKDKSKDKDKAKEEKEKDIDKLKDMAKDLFKF
ncbi:MAG: hypothetical protein JXR97_09225, partial [Planctomycetes bacterium]|nr:hypothetical protein [Planctomycetota bacterium]